MIPSQNHIGVFRRWLTLAFLLGVAAAAPADVYISPGGTGTMSGLDANNTKPARLLQHEIVKLTAGNTIYLTTGTYDLTQLSIVGSGTAGSPKRIVGIPHPVTGALPRFQGAYNAAIPATSTDYLFKFVNYGGAATSHWEIRDLEFFNHGFVFDMPLTGETFALRQNIVFDHLVMDTIEDGIRIRNAENITVRNCTIIRHTKKAFRIGFYSRFITFEDCDTDATGGNDSFPTRSIPVGFGSDSPSGRPIIHDLRFIDCTARNNRFFPQPAGEYWNGDGYSTERGVYNVTYSRCLSVDNHDGGWDDKAWNVLYENCIALRNKRGFRSWDEVVLINCLSAMNAKWGGNSNAVGMWAGSDTGNATVYRSTFHNNEAVQLFGEDNLGITAYNSILSINADGQPTAALTSAIVSADSSNIQFKHPSTGTNPQFSSSLTNSWELIPVDAFNSQFDSTKGYWGQANATTAPSAPGGATATVNTVQASRIDLAWTDNSTNEMGFNVQRSTNGGSYVTIGSSGTNVARYMDTGLAPNTTYAYRVYAYNNIGSSSTYASVSRTTAALSTPATPSGLVLTALTEEGTEVQLDWQDNASNESAYEVHRSFNGTSFAVIATLAQNSERYTDTLSPPNTPLYYRVRALNSVGGANSASQSITLPWVIFADNLDPNAEISPTSPVVWNQATTAPGYWGSNYHANVTPATPASFGLVPIIPSTGSYQVYLRWTQGSNRPTNVPVDIIHAGGTTTLTVDQEHNGGEWRPLGSPVTFNTGTTGKIVIRNTGVNDVAVIADAVRLVSTFTGGLSAPTNLVATLATSTSVNLTWTDQSTGETSFTIERSENGVDFAVIGSAAANATSFSNTGLAAGITYSYRVRPVLSPQTGFASNVASANTPFEVILDNIASAQVTHSPSDGWLSSTTQSGYYGTDYVHDNNTGSSTLKTIVFRPSLPSDGTYQVSARWTAASNRATNAKFLVSGTAGRLPVIVNQTGSNNQWVVLGTVTFKKGTSGSITLLNEGANNFVIGDAVRWVRVGP